MSLWWDVSLSTTDSVSGEPTIAQTSWATFFSKLFLCSQLGHRSLQELIHSELKLKRMSILFLQILLLIVNCSSNKRYHVSLNWHVTMIHRGRKCSCLRWEERITVIWFNPRFTTTKHLSSCHHATLASNSRIPAISFIAAAVVTVVGSMTLHSPGVSDGLRRPELGRGDRT